MFLWHLIWDENLSQLQYTHAAIWAIIAETMLGFGDKAYEFFNMISPIEHSKTKIMAEKYRVEPYVIAADIHGSQNLTGVGGWTWYTGSSSWYYICAIKYILGLNIKQGICCIDPCIPHDWDGFEIKYKYGESVYSIKVNNNNHKCKGVDFIKLDGIIIDNKQIRLMDDGMAHEVEVFM